MFSRFIHLSKLKSLLHRPVKNKKLIYLYLYINYIKYIQETQWISLYIKPGIVAYTIIIYNTMKHFDFHRHDETRRGKTEVHEWKSTYFFSSVSGHTFRHFGFG